MTSQLLIQQELQMYGDSSH